MKTKNIYAYPVDEKDIIRVLTTQAESHRIFKEKNGSFDLSWAVDFLCKESTLVKAALEGKIVKIKNSARGNNSGLDLLSKNLPPMEKQDDNHVIIAHPHDEFSIYSHLVLDGTKISIGQTVTSGELVGFSDRADYEGLSCVHFMVYRYLAPQPSKDLESLEIRWRIT